jgi:hypothetical protein
MWSRFGPWLFSKTSHPPKRGHSPIQATLQDRPFSRISHAIMRAPCPKQDVLQNRPFSNTGHLNRGSEAAHCPRWGSTCSHCRGLFLSCVFKSIVLFVCIQKHCTLCMYSKALYSMYVFKSIVRKTRPALCRNAWKRPKAVQPRRRSSIRGTSTRPTTSSWGSLALKGLGLGNVWVTLHEFCAHARKAAGDVRL